MSSITIWTRLEAETASPPHGFDAAERDRLLAIGAQARVYDPLWLLGRQWQFGEFQGEDAGSPIQAEVRVEWSPMTAYMPSVPVPGSKQIGHRYARDPISHAPVVPLDALVEAEPSSIGGRPHLRYLAEAGLRLARMLVDVGFGRYRAAFTQAYPFPLVAETELDAASVVLQRVVTGRCVDAGALQRQLRASNPVGSTSSFVLPPAPPVSVADRPAMAALLANWLAWYEAGLVTETPAAVPWVPERMEYRFAVAAPPFAGGGETVLVAPSYRGDLDWHTFDCLSGSAGTSLGPIGEARVLPPAALIPTKVHYPGMPSSRFWEFEDARVDLGGVNVEAGDIARLLLLEFSLVYGNDWFVVPIEVVTGSVCRVATLEIVDTFGHRRVIPAAAEGDPGRHSRLFRLTTSGSDATSDVLLVPPVLGPALESLPVEQVRFARDEAANLVWAIERRVESPAGHALDLHRTEPSRVRSVGADSADLAYRLMSSPPRNWLPLLPRDASAAPPVTLELGSVLVDGVIQRPSPRGRVVPADLRLAAEEVPRDGLDVARLYRHARWVDGSTRVWGARRRRPASGEVSSAIQFDFLEQRD